MNDDPLSSYPRADEDLFFAEGNGAQVPAFTEAAIPVAAKGCAGS